MKRVLWLALGIVLGATASATARVGFPRGEFSGFLGLEWKSRCYQPLWPRMASAIPSEISLARSNWTVFQTCVRRAAESDGPYAQAKVYEDALAEIEKVRREGEAAGWRFD